MRLEERLEALLKQIDFELAQCTDEEKRLKLLQQANSVLAKLIRLKRLNSKRGQKHFRPRRAYFDREGRLTVEVEQ